MRWRWLAVGSWGVIGTGVTFFLLTSDYAVRDLPTWATTAGPFVGLALLISLGGRPGLVGAALGMGLSGLTALISLLFALSGCVLGCPGQIWLLPPATALLAVASQQAAMEIWRQIHRPDRAAPRRR